MATPVCVYRASTYAQLLKIDENITLAGHPFFLNFSVLKRDLSDILTLLQQRSRTIEELVRELAISAEQAREAVDFLIAQRFVLTVESSEESQIVERVKLFQAAHASETPKLEGRPYRDYTPVAFDDLSTSIPIGRPRDVKFLILGGCLTQFAADALQQLAPAFGIRAYVEVNWPTESAIAEHFDVVIVQPAISALLGPLWDCGAFISDGQRADRLENLKHRVSTLLRGVRDRSRGHLLLVQGFSTPLYSPLGRTEFRNLYNYDRLVYELNQMIADLIRDDPNAIYVDEERLLSSVGKSRLVDHAVSTFAHHGPIDMVNGKDPRGPGRSATFAVEQTCHAPRLFAQAYIELFVMWAGIGRIKCVIVDLDNTLWPGVVGEGDFDIADNTALQSFSYGVHGGIHQALKVVKQRGVLLATCSRNSESDVFMKWQSLEEIAHEYGLIHILCRDDFVLHKISWERKSASVAAILDALGVSADAALFIDDNAVEREEVRAAFPTIRTMGDNLQLVRSTLLNNPCLQSNVPTTESISRTELVRAQLQRDAMLSSAHDGKSFLRGIDVRLTVTRVRTALRLNRLVELSQRTNQFNTTLARFNIDELRQHVEDAEVAVYILEAADKFAAYGLVGMSVVRQDEITAFALSCRVLPLCAEIPFLFTMLTHYGRVPIRAAIVDGPRNQPCRGLYRQANFDEIGAGKYVLQDLSRLPPIDTAIYQITCQEETQS